MVKFSAPDLGAMQTFLSDFGMSPARDASDGVLRMRRAGDAPFIHETVKGEPGFLGYPWLAGRSKDLIIRGGHDIDPKSIREALARHPAVSEVAADGMPDARLVELPAVFVTVKKGQIATEAELLVFAAEQISERAARPPLIELVESLLSRSVLVRHAGCVAVG